jgi:hypothetical protein
MKFCFLVKRATSKIVTNVSEKPVVSVISDRRIFMSELSSPLPECTVSESEGHNL